MVFNFGTQFHLAKITGLPENRSVDLASREWDGFKFFFLITKTKTDNDEIKYFFRIKVDVPSIYQYVGITHNFNISSGNGPDHLWASKRHHYDDGRNSGPGPFGLGNGIMHSDLIQDYLDPNDQLQVIVDIIKIDKQFNINNIIWELKERILPPEKTELSELQKERDNLVIEVDKLKQGINRSQQEKKEIQPQSKQLEVIHQELTQESNQLSDQNKKYRTEISVTQDRILELQKRLKVGNINEFLRKFDETQVDFNAFQVTQLKELLTKILKLQTRISSQIIEEELCAICMENRRNLALDPCGHLYVCDQCEDDLRSQPEPKCPICMDPFRSTLKVQF